ncbi:MAG: LCP family protein [Tissierellia bacterium]|nr:LCP family protein [Tissierellia bacterium]
MKILYRIFVGLTIILLSLGLYFGYMLKPSQEQKKRIIAQREKANVTEIPRVNAFDGDNPLHILVLGIDRTKTTELDKDDNPSRTDTMMLFTIDPVGKSAQLLSIPRDSYVYVPGHGMTKINHAFAYGEYPLTKKTVEQFLDIDIDFYAIVDYDAVRELTTTVGGVEVYMPVDYKYSDPSVIPPLEIDFHKGYHLVEGDDAVRFLRIRKAFDDQDIGRIGQQQKFLMSLLKKMKRPGMILKLPQLIDIVQNYVDTDLTYGQIADLAYFGLSMDLNNIHTEVLQGGGKRIGEQDYWMVDKWMARKLIKDFLKTSRENVNKGEENENYDIKTNDDGYKESYDDVNRNNKGEENGI